LNVFFLANEKAISAAIRPEYHAYVDQRRVANVSFAKIDLLLVLIVYLNI